MQFVIVVAIAARAFLIQRNPSPVWFLLFGAVTILVGVHIILFQRELTEIARARPQYLPLLRLFWAARFGSRMLIPTGVFVLIIGVVMLVKALLAL
jgi:hypothetical protein